MVFSPGQLIYPAGFVFSAAISALERHWEVKTSIDRQQEIRKLEYEYRLKELEDNYRQRLEEQRIVEKVRFEYQVQAAAINRQAQREDAKTPFVDSLERAYTVLKRQFETGGRKPIVLTAPFYDDGFSRNDNIAGGRTVDFHLAVVNALMRAPWGNTFLRKDGYLERPLIFSQRDVDLIAETLADIPVILVYGTVQGAFSAEKMLKKIQPSIAFWNFLPGQRGEVCHVDLDFLVADIPMDKSSKGLAEYSSNLQETVGNYLARFVGMLGEAYHLIHTEKRPSLCQFKLKDSDELETLALTMSSLFDRICESKPAQAPFYRLDQALMFAECELPQLSTQSLNQSFETWIQNQRQSNRVEKNLNALLKFIESEQVIEGSKYIEKLRDYLTAIKDEQGVKKANTTLEVLEGSIMAPQVEEVIGFDLGHGDTAIAQLSMSEEAPPKMLEIHGQTKNITAIAIDSSNKILIGADALTSPDIKKLDICFKRKPTSAESENDRQAATLKAYMKECYRLLKKKGQIKGGVPSYFVVGCPSGWNEDERERYKKLLKIDDIPFLDVISESRAAFVNYRDENLGAVPYIVTALEKGVLIIDIGSSTTDFTLVINMKEQPKDFGENTLGGSLIDKSIFELTLANHRRRQDVEQAFEKNPSLKARCELACRRAKELYFSKEENYKRSPEQRVKDCDCEIDENTDLYFKPMVSANTIDQILDMPQDQLKGQSWKQYYEMKLKEVKKELEERKIQVGVVLMTGGASRMEFARDIARSVFSEIVKKGFFHVDLESEYSIARGLSRAGRWNLRSAAFKKAVKDLITEKKAVRDVVLTHIPKLIDLLAASLSEDIVENVVKIGLQQWQQKEINTFEEAEAYMQDRVGERLRSQSVKNIVKRECREWLSDQTMLEDLNKKTQPICREYGMDDSGLNLQADLDPDVKAPPIDLEDVIESRPLINLVEEIAEKLNELLAVGGFIGAMASLALGSWMGLLILLIPVAGPWIVEKTKKGIQNLLAEREENLKNWLRTQSLPFGRSFLLDNNKINSECEKMKPEFKQELSKKMTENRQIFEDIVKNVAEDLEKALYKRAEKAVLLVR